MSRRKRRAPAQSTPDPAETGAPAAGGSNALGKWGIFLGGLAAGAVVVVMILQRGPNDPSSPALAVRDDALPAISTADMEPRVQAAIDAALSDATAHPGSVDAWSELGQVCDVHNLHDCAEVAYRRAARLDPADYRWTYLLAGVRELQGAEWEEVVGLYRQVAAADPRFPPTFFRMGEVLQRQGRNAAARKSFEQALALDPKLTIARRSLGQVLVILGEIDAALSALRRCAEEAPDDGPTQAALAQAYTRAGERELATAASDRSRNLASILSLPDPIRFAVMQKGVSADRAFKLGEQSQRAGHLADAVDHFRIAAEARPEDVGLQLRIANLLLRLERHDEARTHLETVVQLDANHTAARLILGDLLVSQAQPQLAIPHYQQAVANDPTNPAALAKLASARGQTGDLEQARTEFEQAATLGDLDAQACFNWATVLLKLHEPAEAAAMYHRATTLFPEYVEAYMQLGLLARAFGHPDQARNYFEKVIELRPDHVRAAEQLATLEGG